MAPKLFYDFELGKMIPYRGERTNNLEKVPYYAARILNIPSSTQITKEEMEYVADQIKEVLRELVIE